jgi:hypothetical protein
MTRKGTAAFACVLAATLALAACGASEEGRFTRTSADAKPYAQAHSACWSEGMMGGAASTVPQDTAYANCMARNGWADRGTASATSQLARSPGVAPPGAAPSYAQCRTAAVARDLSGDKLGDFIDACMTGR